MLLQKLCMSARSLNAGHSSQCLPHPTSIVVENNMEQTAARTEQVSVNNQPIAAGIVEANVTGTAQLQDLLHSITATQQLLEQLALSTTDTVRTSELKAIFKSCQSQG